MYDIISQGQYNYESCLISNDQLICDQTIIQCLLYLISKVTWYVQIYQIVFDCEKVPQWNHTEEDFYVIYQD